ncbi:MAG TPA: recombinase family protein [Candidatus Acidoferrum sp.]|jgi:hypothetical protein|nr:recombinase family protein [Candidatus Acidoferrum sp.]
MAAIYARVSSEQQREENTIASQTALLIEFAKSHDLEVPKEWVFEDEGYSGATLERPGLERVRDLAAEGQIQVVLTYAPDRLSRKYAYQILLIEELARHGVEMLFVKAPQGVSAEDPSDVQRRDDLLPDGFRADIFVSDLRHAGFLSARSSKNCAKIQVVCEYNEIVCCRIGHDFRVARGRVAHLRPVRGFPPGIAQQGNPARRQVHIHQQLHAGGRETSRSSASQAA